jgi:threonine synthase
LTKEELLSCPACGITHAIQRNSWRCDCGSYLDFDFYRKLNPDRIYTSRANIWRYRESIPIKTGTNILTLDEGLTPLTAVTFDGIRLLIKQENLSPTGSFKDRGAAVLVNKLIELGIDEVVEDSSGNAGAALAAYCSAAGIVCNIFVPSSTSSGKLAQIEAYGARIHRITGPRKKAADAAESAAKNLYYASHTWNPFFLHGTKTFAFEVCEQMGWCAPGAVFLPVGNGSLLLGSHMGFRELLKAKIIKKIPRLIAVQAAKCAPIYGAFQRGLHRAPAVRPGKTAAEGISIPNPARGDQILSAVRATEGQVLAVEENEIFEALSMALRSGYYIEPTSAVVLAGIRQFRRQLAGDQTIVTAFTGHGLKSGEKISQLMSGRGSS